MKFTVSTKPLKNGLNLCIIDANVVNFYTKSKLVQIVATKDTLRINHAANLILSEVVLKGLGEGMNEDGSASIMVDPIQLKRLIATITTPQVEFEFAENALIIHSGKSKFSLPMLLDASEVELDAPTALSADDIAAGTEISKAEWKFIKDYQMYAKGDSASNPVYTFVYVGENGDVLVGDFVNSIFTHSCVSKFGKTCLLSDTIINLFNSLPDGAKIISHESTYSIAVSTDGYDYVSEFTPKYESEENGDYSSEIIIGMMHEDEKAVAKVNTSDIITVLNQAALVSTDKTPTINCTVEKNQITFSNSRATGVVVSEGGPDEPYTLIFLANILKSMISNCPESQITISPSFNEDGVAGIVVCSGGLTVVLAGME